MNVRDRGNIAERRIARSLFVSLVVLAMAMGVVGDARAQAYPSKQIRLVVPYAPGGAGDVIARIVSQQLATGFAPSVIVENRPGGAGMIGAMAVATAPPDGYTVLLGYTTEMVVSPYLVKNASYETQRDFRPVALAGFLPQLLVASPSVNVKTIDEFISAARARPSTYSYATAGNGSAAHIAGALLERSAGLTLLNVPYKGGAQAVADVLAGNVSIYFSGIPPAIAHVKAGKLVALGVASTRPVSSLPSVPPLATGALHRLDLSAWFGFFVPKDTPQDIVTTLHTRIRQVLEAPEIQARLLELGVEPASMSVSQFESFVASERRKYQEFLTELAIKSD